jgi:hypothetical protein
MRAFRVCTVVALIGLGAGVILLPWSAGAVDEAANAKPAASASPGPAGSIIMGVNVYDEPFISQSAQDAEIQRLASNGVKTIRTGLSAKSIYFITQAYRHGIGTVAIVHPFYGGKLKAEGKWARVPLSQVNQEDLKGWLKPNLDALEAAGVHLTAIEFGNELNCPDYNADIAAPGSGRTLGLADLNNPKDPEGSSIAAGFRVYLRVLAVVKDLRDHSRLNSKTPLLSGFSGDWGVPAKKSWNGQLGVSIPAAIGYLREKGLDSMVDGYAVHTYPTGDPNAPMSSRVTPLAQNIFAACTPGGKPCWVTEWGIGNPDQSCPVNDAKRLKAFEAERSAFKQFVDQRRVAAILYFDWSGAPGEPPNGAAIYRCGELTNAGKVAISPI